MGPRLAIAVALLLPAAAPALADRYRLEMDAAETRIRFELGATLHTVHGRFTLLSGHVVLDDSSGALSGAVVVDARSGDTGNDTRDANMHEQILESERFTEITLHPDRLEIEERGQNGASGTLVGTIDIHGGSHPVRIPVTAEQLPGGRGRVSGSFDLPYVAWGMRDLSNFVLRVDDTLRVRFEAEGALEVSGQPVGPGAGP